MSDCPCDNKDMKPHLPGCPEYDAPLFTKPKSMRWVCREVAADMERDVQAFNGRVLSGPLVAEIHATLAAGVAALAQIVEQLCPEER